MITAFVLIMAAVALVWIVWTNLVLQQKDAGAKLSPAPYVQQVHYPADPVDIR